MPSRVVGRGTRDMEYRLYFLRDGHIRRAVSIRCDSDEQAIAEAEQHADGSPMELWEHARLVKKFGGDAPGPERSLF